MKWRRGLALGNAPDARISSWRYQHVGILEPTHNVTPDANPQRQSVEYRWRWVPNARFSRWPCTFHVVYVNFICVGHQTQTRFSVEYGLLSVPTVRWLEIIPCDGYRWPHRIESSLCGFTPYRVNFGYSGHGYSGHLDIVATLAGTESFPIISSLNRLLIVATHFGYS